MKKLAALLIYLNIGMFTDLCILNSDLFESMPITHHVGIVLTWPVFPLWIMAHLTF